MDIKKLSISDENKIREKQVFEEIIKCIDGKNSMVFDAGAGSGKTYALAQSLKYIINQYGWDLKLHNQQVLCITYTNIAVAEVKEFTATLPKALKESISKDEAETALKQLEAAGAKVKIV